MATVWGCPPIVYALVRMSRTSLPLREIVFDRCLARHHEPILKMLFRKWPLDLFDEMFGAGDARPRFYATFSPGDTQQRKRFRRFWKTYFRFDPRSTERAFLCQFPTIHQQFVDGELRRRQRMRFAMWRKAVVVSKRRNGHD